MTGRDVLLPPSWSWSFRLISRQLDAAALTSSGSCGWMPALQP